MIAAAIAETGAAGPRDMGQVMKAVMAASGGRADGKRASARVREALGRSDDREPGDSAQHDRARQRGGRRAGGQPGRRAADAREPSRLPTCSCAATCSRSRATTPPSSRPPPWCASCPT